MKDATFSSARLLELYDRISDAEDAIPRLRRFVLDLAVRGKLVEQDASEEPAVELLKRITLEKAQLVKAGEIKNPKPLPPVEDDADFEVPPNWIWTRLGIITSYIQRGKSPKYAVSDGALVVSQKCVQWSGLDLSVAKQVTLESLAQYEGIRFLREGDLLWNSTGTGTIGRIIRLGDVPEKLVCDSHVTVVRSLLVDPEYIRLWVQSDHVYALIEGRAAGSTNQVELTAKMAINQVIPLPPLAEQHRIVAKVDELMALCDQLEQARAGREAVRDRLTTASLARLTAPDTDAEIFQSHARFALHSLPILTSRPDQIKTLRQTILNLAVRGKLVEQDLTDEPAAELHKALAAEFKKTQTTAVRGKRSEALGIIAEPPFDVPALWSWAQMGDLGQTNIGLTYSPGNVGPTGTPVLRSNNVQNGKIDLNNLVRVDFEPKPSAMVAEGDMLICARNGSRSLVGKAALIERLSEPMAFGAFMALFRSPINPYLHLFLSSPIFRQVIDEVNTTTINQITQANLRSTFVPLPPLAEQHRIVAKVDSLMALCDQLEASLTATATTRIKLLNTLLHEALAPARETAEA